MNNKTRLTCLFLCFAASMLLSACSSGGGNQGGSAPTEDRPETFAVELQSINITRLDDGTPVATGGTVNTGATVTLE